MPVWLAMSELFLDTEQDARDHARIRGILAASGYDSAELRRILERELLPVLGHNLLSPVGEWAGWSEADLRRLLLPRAERGPGRAGWLMRLLLGRWLAGQWAAIDPGT